MTRPSPPPKKMLENKERIDMKALVYLLYATGMLAIASWTAVIIYMALLDVSFVVTP